MILISLNYMENFKRCEIDFVNVDILENFC